MEKCVLGAGTGENKLKDAKNKVVYLTKQNEELRNKNNKLNEMKCPYSPNDHEVFTSRVTVKSLASNNNFQFFNFDIFQSYTQKHKDI